MDLTRLALRLGPSLALVACGSRTGLDVDTPSEDAGAADVSKPVDAAPERDAREASPPICDYGTVVGDIYGQRTYFAGGAPLPAGHYRLTYVDGCMMYTNNGSQGWTVNGYSQTNGTDEWYLVGKGGLPDGEPEPPGTVGYLVGQGAYATFDACVAASLRSPPVTFDSAGGPIGIWLDDDPYSDNVSGTGGRNPTWHLGCAEQ